MLEYAPTGAVPIRIFVKKDGLHRACPFPDGGSVLDMSAKLRGVFLRSMLPGHRRSLMGGEHSSVE